MRAAEKHSHMGSMKVSGITVYSAALEPSFGLSSPDNDLVPFSPSCVVMPRQDFSMDFGHCPEITVYTGCCLFPPADQLAALWAENKKPLLSMLVEVRRTSCSDTDRLN